MKKDEKNKEEKKENNDWFIDNYKSMRLAVFGQAAIFTLVMIAIFGAIGYGLDLLFGTYPTIFIIGLFAGYPATVILIRRKFKKYGEKKLKEKNNGN